jgi:hypothetical protein
LTTLVKVGSVGKPLSAKGLGGASPIFGGIALTNQKNLTKSRLVIASRETASSPSAQAGGVSISGPALPLRAALYIDAFNFYHAIDELNQPHLKWLNLAALGERIIQRGKERLVKVRWFTALQPRAPEDKKQRHREYISALKHYNVTVHQGHFIFDKVDCHKCPHTWEKPQEKETDVSIALRTRVIMHLLLTH